MRLPSDARGPVGAGGGDNSSARPGTGRRRLGSIEAIEQPENRSSRVGSSGKVKGNGYAEVEVSMREKEEFQECLLSWHVNAGGRRKQEREIGCAKTQLLGREVEKAGATKSRPLFLPD